MFISGHNTATDMTNIGHVTERFPQFWALHIITETIHGKNALVIVLVLPDKHNASNYIITL